MAQYRPRLTEEEYDIITQLREKHKALSEECEASGIPVEDVKYYWYKSDKFSINVRKQTKSYEEVKDDIIAQMLRHAPKYKTIERKFISEPHLLVIDPADIHIGKLASRSETGEDYNVKTAINRVIEGVDYLINKCSGFPIDRILYIVGNDILHTDTTGRTTTGGTPQDTDGMWYDNFIKAKDLHINIIDKLRLVANVHVQYDPSNHDRMSGFFLADTLSSWYFNDEHVTFSVGPSYRKYYRYHSNLIGTTHGDGAKEADLPLLMAHETGADWHECKHKYIYTHHIHHKRSKDYMGVTIESMRSPSGPDSYHHKYGYMHSPKGIDAFVHHPVDGQIARISHIIS
jgi:hypothetical protein